jgi:hypothetical protein
MVDLPTATQSLFFDKRNRLGTPSREMEVLDEGVVHIDYGDPDHLFIARIQVVPRLRLPVREDVVTQVEEVDVRIVDVSVHNFISVTVRGIGSAADSIERDYEEKYAAWLEDPSGQSPTYPAERLSLLTLSVQDDLGTRYEFRSGMAGGEDPWAFTWRFTPTPPDTATGLRVSMGSADVHIALLGNPATPWNVEPPQSGKVS